MLVRRGFRQNRAYERARTAVRISMKRAGRNARHAALAAHGLQRHVGVDRVVWPIRNPSVAAPPVIRTLAKKRYDSKITRALRAACNFRRCRSFRQPRPDGRQSFCLIFPDPPSFAFVAPGLFALWPSCFCPGSKRLFIPVARRWGTSRMLHRSARKGIALRKSSRETGKANRG